jgi:uroporphyrinogen-III decarboxylase
MIMKWFDEGEIEERKDFLTRLWKLEKVDRPGYMLNGFAVGEENDPDRPPPASTREWFMNWDLMLKSQLYEIKLRSQLKDDYIPHLFPYLGTGVLASAFGCEVIYPEVEQPWTKPIVRNPEDVYKLKEPEPTGGLLKDVLDLTKFMVEKTNGELPIRMTDIQGPLDTASLIWEYSSFLTAMYTAPDAVHTLLDMVTELIIDFVPMQKELCEEFIPNHCPGVWVPEDWGISISEDLVAVVSPHLYEEFAIPYNQKLADAFNGLHIHSCGNFAFNYENLKKIDKLRGVDMGVTETDYPKAVEVLKDKCLLIPRIGGAGKIGVDFPSTNEYLDYVVENSDDANIFIFIDKFGADVDLEKLKEKYEWLWRG